MVVGDRRHAPATLSPRKTRYPLYRRLGGPQSRSGQVREISPPTRIRFPDRPARSVSLYRLSYRRLIIITITIIIIRFSEFGSKYYGCFLFQKVWWIWAGRSCGLALLGPYMKLGCASWSRDSAPSLFYHLNTDSYTNVNLLRQRTCWSRNYRLHYWFLLSSTETVCFMTVWS